jgi:hypothetical protein
MNSVEAMYTPPTKGLHNNDEYNKAVSNHEFLNDNALMGDTLDTEYKIMIWQSNTINNLLMHNLGVIQRPRAGVC